MSINFFDESLSPLVSGVAALVTALITSYFSIPVIVKIARTKGLVARENHRTSHHGSVPNLGGVAIFAGLILGSSLFVHSLEIQRFRYVLVALIIIFFMGQKDDILGLSAWAKLIGQLAVALILIFLADIRINSFHGFAGIHEIPFWVSVLVSVFLYLVIINAFNLIDGIDGLASGTGIMVSFIFGAWLFGIGHPGMGVMAWSLTGGLIPFFVFNVFGTKNKLFMGDTGSLMIGMMAAVFVITICQYELPADHWLHMRALPSVAIAVLVYPLFDILRIVTLRVIRNSNPLKPDRHHIHHLFIDSGISHRRSSFYIILLNLLAIALAWIMRNQSILLLGLILLAGSIAMVGVVKAVGKRKQREEGLGG